jgi:hypothetical protein
MVAARTRAATTDFTAIREADVKNRLSSARTICAVRCHSGSRRRAARVIVDVDSNLWRLSRQAAEDLQLTTGAEVFAVSLKPPPSISS